MASRRKPIWTRPSPRSSPARLPFGDEDEVVTWVGPVPSDATPSPATGRRITSVLAPTRDSIAPVGTGWSEAPTKPGMPKPGIPKPVMPKPKPFPPPGAVGPGPFPSDPPGPRAEAGGSGGPLLGPETLPPTPLPMVSPLPPRLPARLRAATIKPAIGAPIGGTTPVRRPPAHQGHPTTDPIELDLLDEQSAIFSDVAPTGALTVKLAKTWTHARPPPTPHPEAVANIPTVLRRRNIPSVARMSMRALPPVAASVPRAPVERRLRPSFSQRAAVGLMAFFLAVGCVGLLLLLL